MNLSSWFACQIFLFWWDWLFTGCDIQRADVVRIIQRFVLVYWISIQWSLAELAIHQLMDNIFQTLMKILFFLASILNRFSLFCFGLTFFEWLDFMLRQVSTFFETVLLEYKLSLLQERYCLSFGVDFGIFEKVLTSIILIADIDVHWVPFDFLPFIINIAHKIHLLAINISIGLY